jgi:hypothetical protein
MAKFQFPTKGKDGDPAAEKGFPAAKGKGKGKGKKAKGKAKGFVPFQKGK